MIFLASHMVKIVLIKYSHTKDNILYNDDPYYQFCFTTVIFSDINFFLILHCLGSHFMLSVS